MLNEKVPYRRSNFKVVIARPIIKSKRGPAKQPVIAIDPYPFLEIVIQAWKSPYELPIAMTVIPKKLLLMPKMSPMSCNRSTIKLAANHIQTIHMKKDQRIKKKTPSGA
jgi:hypothetical protein